MAHEHVGEGAALKQAGYGSTGENLQEQPSPYTNFQSKEDYVKGAYGGEGFEPTVPPKEEQPNYYAASAPPPAVAPDEPKAGIKEKIKEKLPGGYGPSEPADDETAASGPPKKGVVEKVKEKISSH